MKEATPDESERELLETHIETSARIVKQHLESLPPKERKKEMKQWRRFRDMKELQLILSSPKTTGETLNKAP